MEGWQPIGSEYIGEKSGIKLALIDKEETKIVDNVIRVTWSIQNTGNKSIDKFEIVPNIRVPDSVNILTTVIGGRSDDLRVADKMSIINNIVYVDSLGIFNPGEFFEMDIYLYNVPEDSSISYCFDEWVVCAKSSNLSLQVVPKKEKEKVIINKFLFNFLVGSVIGTVLILVYYLAIQINVSVRFLLLIRVFTEEKRIKILIKSLNEPERGFNKIVNKHLLELLENEDVKQFADKLREERDK